MTEHATRADTPSRFARWADALRSDRVGGLLLVLGAVAGLVWANSAWSDSYTALGETRIGPAALHLDMSVTSWASDGLLTVFFFLVGLELKHEFVLGSLRDPRKAITPMTAALGGMVVPAVVFVVMVAREGSDAMHGWAVPTATDIAFAVAVLAVVGTYLPAGVRTFLLTLAVVDDLLAVTVIAIFYTDSLSLGHLALAFVPLAVFAAAAYSRKRPWWIIVPAALVTWYLVHESGVHATLAGVALGFAVPAIRGDERPASALGDKVRPFSAGLAVPVFAFFAAGVSVGGLSGLIDTVTDPLAVAVAVALVVGKVTGIVGSTFLVTRTPLADLDESVTWPDIAGVGLLGGIGFTVSLLIGELAFGHGTIATDHVTIGVLIGSAVSAILGGIVLSRRNRYHRDLLLRRRAARAADRPDAAGSA